VLILAKSEDQSALRGVFGTGGSRSSRPSV
jgi:hypothetical protein